jgi:hypothetical protein
VCGGGGGGDGEGGNDETEQLKIDKSENCHASTTYGRQ